MAAAIPVRTEAPVKIIVIGAGVIGVTSAWYLARDGHEVTVVERTGGVARETSFGNAGGVCPGFAGPWAAPGMPLKALKWMFKPAPPLKIRPRFDFEQWDWLARFVLNCAPRRFADNKAQMQRMAHFSLAALRELRAETGITYDNQSKGILQIFCTRDEAEAGERAAEVLTRLGVAHELLGDAGARAVEPALRNSDVRIAGALHLSDDETGDCHLFCQALAKLAEARGVTFRFETEATDILIGADRVSGVRTRDEMLAADAVVLAAGPWARDLLNPLGVRMPLYPVKGYSLTAEITDADRAPVSSVMDEHSKIMFTRLGSRLRVAGVAELAGFDRRLTKAALAGLRKRSEALFPGAAEYETAAEWCGFRPMLPDGPARVGAAGPEGLWLNLGHGSNGWTQACGASRHLATGPERTRPQATGSARLAGRQARRAGNLRELEPARLARLSRDGRTTLQILAMMKWSSCCGPVRCLTNHVQILLRARYDR